jgi:glycosyltransferase involved in cell wall biosynthesis
MPPLVSILIPAYNSEAAIGATIESALAQTWPCTEIIVVNDGSKDRTLEVAKTFSSPRVTVVSQPNQGAAAARNKALSLSRGDYVQWLDADDLLSPDKIAKQMAVAESLGHKKRLLSSEWGHFMHRPHKAEFRPTALWCDLSPSDWLVRKLEFNLHMQTATWLVSRELSKAAGPWDTRLLGDDDGEYFCRVLLASDGVCFVPGARVYYRRSVGSLSWIGASDRKMETQLLSMKMHIEYLRSLEESDRVRAACVKYLQRYLLYFYPNRLDLVEQARALAASLGGELATPTLPWKYNWIQKLFGWRLGKRAWIALPRLRESFARRWDKLLFCLENRRDAAEQSPVTSSV